VAYDVSVRAVGPRVLAATRSCAALVDLPTVIRPRFDVVYAFLRESAIPHLGLNVILYGPPGGGEVDFECGVEVAAPFEGGATVRLH
jgi:hypothetical protein